MQQENIFYILAKACIPIPDNYFRQPMGDALLVFLFNAYHLKGSESKFDFFEASRTNPFFTAAQITKFEDCFCQIQRARFALSRFALLWKIKHAKTAVDTDLGLNPIQKENNDVIVVLQNKNKFYFRVNDLINLIQSNLSHSNNFFCEPLVIKNPFNNVPFNKSTLYNIYFTLREKSAVFPELFHKFFLCNFNMLKFTTKYEYLIQEHAINNYVYTASTESLISYIDEMVSSVKEASEMCIDVDFPEELLIQIMRPYLKLYLMSCYSLITVNKMRAQRLLGSKLKRFVHYNPYFGRKIMKSKKYFCTKKQKYKTKVETSFNDNCIDFDDENYGSSSSSWYLSKRKKISDFLSSHLQNT